MRKLMGKNFIMYREILDSDFDCTLHYDNQVRMDTFKFFKGTLPSL